MFNDSHDLELSIHKKKYGKRSQCVKDKKQTVHDGLMRLFNQATGAVIFGTQHVIQHYRKTNNLSRGLN